MTPNQASKQDNSFEFRIKLSSALRSRPPSSSVTRCPGAFSSGPHPHSFRATPRHHPSESFEGRSAAKNANKHLPSQSHTRTWAAFRTRRHSSRATVTSSRKCRCTPSATWRTWCESLTSHMSSSRRPRQRLEVAKKPTQLPKQPLLKRSRVCRGLIWRHAVVGTSMTAGKRCLSFRRRRHHRQVAGKRSDES